MQSYADVVESYLLAEQVVDAEGLDVAPQALQGRVSASVVPDTVLLDIVLTSADAAEAQALAAAYAEQFIELVAELEEQPDGGEALVSARVINPALLPTNPVSPRPLLTIGLAVVLSLLAGVTVGTIRDTLDTTIKSPQDVSDISGSPGLGVIAYDPEAAKKPLVVDVSPHSPRAEAFRQLRTNLQFIDVDSDKKVIAVTSSVSTEGKTTTAVNLALALAEAGVRVLLVEGDLRRPRVAELLGLIGEVGLTNVLLGEIDLETALQSVGESGLTVIASGPRPPNPSELLQSRAMTDLLKELRGLADVVLIDAPPLLPVADAAILSTIADGALLVVRHGYAKRDQVHQSVMNLTKVDARLLGTILSMSPSRAASSYGYGYGYGEPPEATDQPRFRRGRGRHRGRVQDSL